MTTTELFHSKGNLQGRLVAQERAAMEAVRDLPAERVLAGSDADLVAELYERFSVEPLQLHPEHAYTPTGVADAKVMAGFAPRYVTEVRGTHYELAIPFDGEDVLFHLRPSVFTHNIPRAEVRTGEVIIVYESANPTQAETIKQHLDVELGKLRTWCEWSAADCRAHNDRLKTSLGPAVAQQRQKVTADRAMEASLPFPVRRRSDPENVLKIGLPRRRPTPAVVARPASTDPRIEPEEFAAIVADIASVGRAVERFPETFGTMDEPVPREILLVVLNNQFGPSGGEVFSRRGKTDIAIWHQTGALFIAECKIWSGARDFYTAINQLLGYLVWRDTKSALVLFVREKDVTAVGKKAQDGLREHRLHKRQAADVSGCPVFVLHHDGDDSREIQMALIVVPVSSAAKRPTARAAQPTARGE